MATEANALPNAEPAGAENALQVAAGALNAEDAAGAGGCAKAENENPPEVFWLCDMLLNVPLGAAGNDPEAEGAGVDGPNDVCPKAGAGAACPKAELPPPVDGAAKAENALPAGVGAEGAAPKTNAVHQFRLGSAHTSARGLPECRLPKCRRWRGVPRAEGAGSESRHRRL